MLKSKESKEKEEKSENKDKKKKKKKSKKDKEEWVNLHTSQIIIIDFSEKALPKKLMEMLTRILKILLHQVKLEEMDQLKQGLNRHQ